MNTRHQQFEFGFAVLLLSPVVCSIMAFIQSLQIEEVAMSSKRHKHKLPEVKANVFVFDQASKDLVRGIVVVGGTSDIHCVDDTSRSIDKLLGLIENFLLSAKYWYTLVVHVLSHFVWHFLFSNTNILCLT